MEQRETQAYRRSLKGSIGAGIGSVFRGSGKTYFILEHKVSSKFHKAGESQEIIVNQIELGRDSRCQVRFDESFNTVSRRHAAIVREGDMWKLVQLSTTNSTFLNGKKIQREWYLQNGDEIQLAINGPKLGFIIPTGNRATVGSIGLSRRLSLFRQQALRPYRRVITILTVALILAIGSGTGYSVWQKMENDKIFAKLKQQTEELFDKNKELQELVTLAEEENKRQDSIMNVMKNRPAIIPSQNIANQIALVKEDVYLIITTCYMQVGGTVKEIGTSSGTGFMLSDGRFVTARHCVESWLFSESPEANMMTATYPEMCTVYSIIHAYNSKSEQFTLRSSDFVIDRSLDVVTAFGGRDENGTLIKIRLAWPVPLGLGPIGSEEMYAHDWAYARISRKSNLTADYAASATLRAGEELHMLGFPRGLGVADGPQMIEPIYNKMSVSRDNLNSTGCIMVSQGVEHGNSGGPLFLMKNGKLVVVGIVSRGDSHTEQYNHLVPIRQINK
ncbi:MAG: FHA domain-containing protein [Tannerella sp.]|jgi:pSer/pThr/pTyr-binding forkhead associated (FHA) protein|nr:FHA domain-containing protein [Tannerella sp.]